MGLALRERSPDADIRAWTRRPDSRAEILSRNFATSVTTDVAEAVHGARTIVFCVPVEHMAALARDVAPATHHDAVFTDAGSVKASVVAELEPLLGPRFVGAHPIAGSEQSGLAAARADLFAAAPCVLTPTPLTSPHALAAAADLWRTVGCRIAELTPAAHDAALARTSHLPHLTASALVAAAFSGSDDLTNLLGPGFRDSTRVAQGNADLWTGILLANRSAVASSVADLTIILHNVHDMLTHGDEESLRQFLKHAADNRQAVTAPPTHAVQG